MRFAIIAAAVALGLSAATAVSALTASDVPKTRVNSAAALQRLVNAKGISLQWNWNAPRGTFRATVHDGYLTLHGEQRDPKGGSLALDGVVTRIDERVFTFRGRIVLHDAEADVDCVRDGDYTFRITGARKYWRMKEQEAHCEGRADLTDYVDIYF
jgi:hypothetical protein